MLPSFRLIAATFLCGFAVVYASLRVAMSLSGALPVTAAHAGGHVLPVADGAIHVASVPAMFDTRFAITAVPVVQVRSTPSVLQRPALPLSVVPQQDAAAADAIPVATVAESAEQQSKPEGVLAAVQPDPPAGTVAPAETVTPLPDTPPTDPQQ